MLCMLCIFIICLPVNVSKYTVWLEITVSQKCLVAQLWSDCLQLHSVLKAIYGHWVSFPVDMLNLLNKPQLSLNKYHL